MPAYCDTVNVTTGTTEMHINSRVKRKLRLRLCETGEGQEHDQPDHSKEKRTESG